MSFRVLVIPEDPTLNGYILRPLAEAVVADAGRPRARLEVLTNPRIQGYDQAVRAIRDDLPALYRLCPELKELRDRIEECLAA